MIILVTGSCGFIGSHLCETLLKLYPNYKIYGIDSLHNFFSTYELKLYNRSILCQYPQYHQIDDDIMNQNYIQKIEPDIIIHLAGYGNVLQSGKEPNYYIHNNINITTKILHEIRFLKKQPLFLYASSSTVYGKNKKIPFQENDSLENITNVYGLTKKMCEEMVDLYCKLYSLRAIGFRFFSVYGPRGRPDMAIPIFF